MECVAMGILEKEDGTMNINIFDETNIEINTGNSLSMNDIMKTNCTSLAIDENGIYVFTRELKGQFKTPQRRKFRNFVRKYAEENKIDTKRIKLICIHQNNIHHIYF